MKRKISLLTALLLVVGFYSSTAFALDPMGPPTAELLQGQSRAGVDGSESRMDIELEHGTYSYTIGKVGQPPTTSTSGKVNRTKLKHLKMHKLYANLGYGVLNDWEMFLRLGGMNTEFSGNMFSNNTRETIREYNGDTGFAVGFGTKVTLYQHDRLKLGGLFQISRASSKAKYHSTATTNVDETVELDIIEMQIAIGPTYKLDENISIYGGPFWHFIDLHGSDSHGKRTELWPEQQDISTDKTSYDVGDISHFGGYVGTQIELTKDNFYNIEYQHTRSADALAMHLFWKF